MTACPSEPLPSVSVIIPARNAEATLAAALDSVLSQDYAGSVEVLVADGSDTPATVEMVRQRYPSVRLIPNPDQLLVPGLVAAMQVATGAVIVRCDAHTMFQPGYLRRAIETLARTGAANVGGRQQPVGTTFFERTVAVAMTTPLGAGYPRYRLGGPAGPTDTVYLGVFQRAALDAVGGYDATLFGNEDYEVNYRLRQRGETVWFDPVLAVLYRPPQYAARPRPAVFQLWPDEGRGVAAASALAAVPTDRRSAAGAGLGSLGLPNPRWKCVGGGDAARLCPHPDGWIAGGRHPPPHARRAPPPAGPRDHASELGASVSFCRGKGGEVPEG